VTGPAAGPAKRTVRPAVVLAVAAVLSLPAIIPLVLHNGCGELVIRSAVRNKSHYHHVADPDPARSARSIQVRRCITRARNRIFLSAVELTPILVVAAWLLFVRPRDG
jgi:hypothetical protein